MPSVEDQFFSPYSKDGYILPLCHEQIRYTQSKFCFHGYSPFLGIERAIVPVIVVTQTEVQEIPQKYLLVMWNVIPLTQCPIKGKQSIVVLDNCVEGRHIRSDQKHLSLPG